MMIRFPIACLAALAMAPACAQSHGEPVLPPSLRQPAPQPPPTSGDALNRQALQKLKQRFDEADANHDGSLTQDEARAGGLGYIADRFTEIDSSRKGAVSFGQVRDYMMEGKRKSEAHK